jgi:hypothetical protein
MDCCQLEDHIASRGVKREETSGNDPENGSPDSDSAGMYILIVLILYNPPI